MAGVEAYLHVFKARHSVEVSGEFHATAVLSPEKKKLTKL
jgi:hypothetical protein